MNNNFIWINGELLPSDRVPADLLTGAHDGKRSLVKVFRIYATDAGPAIFRLADHIRQFFEEVRRRGYKIHRTEEELCEMVRRTLLFNKIREGTIRATLLVRSSENGWAASPYADDDGMVLAVSTHPFGESAAAAGQTAEGTAVILDRDVPGDFTLFLVKDGQILTPPSRHFGNAIVRASVMTLARDLGYRVKETRLTRSQVMHADEVFLANAVGEIRYVSEFNARSIGDRQPGPVTRALQHAFRSTTQGRSRRSQEWLEWVGGSYIGL